MLIFGEFEYKDNWSFFIFAKKKQMVELFQGVLGDALAQRQHAIL